MAGSPTLVFDGDCGFCTRSVLLACRVLPAGVRYVAWQDADLDSLGVSERECRAAVQWVPVAGPPAAGHRAVAAALQTAGGAWPVVGRLLLVPLISPVAARVYHWIADHRARLPGVAPACGWAVGDRAELAGRPDDGDRPRA